jgi:hypothetical protein
MCNAIKEGYLIEKGTKRKDKWKIEVNGVKK